MLISPCMIRDDTLKAEAAREAFPLLTDPVSKESIPLFVENLRRGAKARGEWTCGVELELIGYDCAHDYARLTPAQVQRVLAGFAPSSNDLVHESGVLVEVNAGQMNRLTVEPGGQIEFSGATTIACAPRRSNACSRALPLARTTWSTKRTFCWKWTQGK